MKISKTKVFKDVFLKNNEVKKFLKENGLPEDVIYSIEYTGIYYIPNASNYITITIYEKIND